MAFALTAFLQHKYNGLSWLSSQENIKSAGVLDGSNNQNENYPKVAATPAFTGCIEFSSTCTVQ